MDSRIIYVLNYIEMHLGDRLSLLHLADRAHLSPSQFHRLFKKETGRTPFRFVEELRQVKAMHLVKHTDLDIVEISDRLGYKNYETFSRAFRKKHHLSPDDYRGIIQALNKSFIDHEDELIILTTAHPASEDELMAQIKEVIQKNNISEESLATAKVFKILPQTASSEQDKFIVRNKYELSEDPCLWRQILDG